MGMLHHLELENFKSYKGKHIIGPFTKFTAIIGPNGSGKSNLMDSISFVLGEKPTSLRVKKLGDLIHGAPIGKPVAKCCYVTMNYIYDDGKKKAFTRGVNNGTSEFKINGKPVTVQQYNQEMESIQIFIKAKNFLVYQGAIESIAMKNPKERTVLFEELSRSCEFQQQYERLKSEMTRAEDDTQQNMHKRRGIAQEKREAKMEKDEAEKYRLLKDEVLAKQKVLFLHQLFHCERIMKDAKEQLAEQRKSISHLEKNKSEEDARVAKHQSELKKTQRESHKMDKKIADKEKDIAIQRPLYVQAKAEVQHHKQKLETAKKSLNAAQGLAENNKEQLEKLEAAKREVEEKKEEFEKETAQQTQQQQLNLSDEQIQEYQTLKRVALMESGRLELDLTAAKQVLETEKSNINHERRRQTEQEQRVHTKEDEVRRVGAQIEQIETKIKETEEIIEEERKNLGHVEKQVVSTKGRMDEVNKELLVVIRDLQEASGDYAEGERNQRRNEAIDNLKRVFPDKVHGRLVDLCQPSHKRFQLAVTKVLQTHMMSIVCDNAQTARDAITYLKEQRFQPETFLPLDKLDVHPINEKLREIKRPSGVKLVFDVINVNNQVAMKALQFACGNALVCEHQDDAKQLAYGGSGLQDRYKAVAMDGTLFQSSGVMSGGSADLRQKAKKWDEKVLRSLREKKAKLQDEHNTLSKSRKKELDVEMQRNKIYSTEKKLEYMGSTLKRLRDEVQQRLNFELESLVAELKVFPLKIESIEEKLVRHQKTVTDLEEQSNAVADRVFAGFCASLGLANIREYEDRELKIHQEQQDKLRQFDNDIDRLKNEIEYLKSEDRTKKVKTEKDKVSRIEKELKEHRSREKKEQQALSELEESLEMEKAKLADKKEIVEKLEQELADAKKAAQAATREVNTAEKSFIGLEAIVQKKANDRHNLLHTAKMNQLKLPLSHGSLADVDADDYDEDEEDEDGASTSKAHGGVSNISQEQIQREGHIKLDYTLLPREYQEIEDEDNVKKMTDRLNKELSEVQAQVSKMNAPNAKANERMEEVKEREAESHEELENARKKAKRIRQQFEKIKTERYRRFQEFFEPVSSKIDEIYKSLCRNQSAQAFIGADNMEEPYLEGIQYNCVAPGKRFRPMDNLSGGEKTIAALALLFAVHARNPSPFFVLDEIDAALDNTNIGKVASFICDTASQDMQIIVISLKEEFYNKADSLVGIYPQPAAVTTSGVLTFDLTNFKQTGLNETIQAETANAVAVA